MTITVNYHKSYLYFGTLHYNYSRESNKLIMESKKQIETGNGIKGEYEVKDKFSMKIWMTEPYNLFVKVELNSGTFKDEKDIKGWATFELEYLYNCIEVVKPNLKEFEKLSVSYSSCESGWHIKMFNTVFYSSYEEDRFRQDMRQSLKENYSQMYDEYIKNQDPIYKTFKDKLSPSILSIIIKAIHD